MTDSKTVTHSYGKGSMDEVEEYDTGVPCDECRAPSAQGLRGAAAVRAGAGRVPVAHPQVVVARHAVNATASSAAGQQASAQAAIAVTDISPAQAAVPPPLQDSVARFGPAGCVSAWRAPATGSCQLETACAPGLNLSTYEFGLICVDAAANVTRHLFGRGSMGSNETFDTQLVCNHCLGLDSPDAETVFGLGDRVARLEGSIGQMTGTITWLQGQVQQLQASHAQAAQAAAAAPAPAVALVRAAARVHGAPEQDDDDDDDDPSDQAF